MQDADVSAISAQKDHPLTKAREASMLKIRFRFDGKCRIHSRYNPSEHGRPTDPTCPGCETLYVIHLYTAIARRRAQNGGGLIVSRPESPAETSQAADGVLEAVPSSTETAEP